MTLEALERRAWFAPFLGIALFVLVFAVVFAFTLPGEVILSLVEPRFGRAGIVLQAHDARLLFPVGLSLDNASIGFRGLPAGLSCDRASARFSPTGLLRGLPIRARLERGPAFLDYRGAGLFTAPGKGFLSAGNIPEDDLSRVLGRGAFSFAVERLDVSWKREGKAGIVGTGNARLSSLRVPVPSPDSPVREAILRDVEMRFAIRDGTIHVSSLNGEYEGSEVEGTGEIAGIGTPTRGSITFQIRIRNPYEGNVAALFNLVAKNAKNANLRIHGPLLSPSGEFRFF